MKTGGLLRFGEEGKQERSTTLVAGLSRDREALSSLPNQIRSDI